MVSAKTITDKNNQHIQQEWLVTNGIGGFASSTVPCINTRRYHGVLIASQRPPIERVAIVSRLQEEITIDGRHYFLSSARIEGGKYTSNGCIHLERFEQKPLPVWYYQIRDVLIIKSLNMVYGQNTTIVTYKILSNENRVSFKVTPYYLFRDFHANQKQKNLEEKALKLRERQLSLKPFANSPELFIRWDRGSFKEEISWQKDIFLSAENKRGLPDTEDDFSIGSIEVNSFSGSFSVAFSDQPITSFNPIDLRKREEQRLESISNSIESEDRILKELLLAGDQFIVERKSTGGKTILAGYPWFSDWGRDTLIALHGLTLVTNRIEDAKSILKTFASSIKNGLIPNCFADIGNDAVYNSVDASLWFFIAVYKYLEYTGDYAFIKEHLLSAMTEIIEAFQKGTDFDIKMDSKDGLISAGNKDIQLTWMDVKVEGETVTPRNGKAVEINALWYNALKIYTLIQETLGNNASELKKLAIKVKASFKKTFWNEKSLSLYDYIKPDGTPDESFRPNQIYAVYLPFELLDSDEEKQIVDSIFAKLYTSYGLRSLSPEDPKYKAFYKGDRIERDRCYHQGTVWAFLIGPFISSYLKVNNNSVESQLRASLMIEPFIKHMHEEECLGSISEVFDGDMPHNPGGCFAQAWSVAEILRCYVEDIKGQKPAMIG